MIAESIRGRWCSLILSFFIKNKAPLLSVKFDKDDHSVMFFVGGF